MLSELQASESNQANLFQFNPTLSDSPDRWLKEDPDFRKAKPVPIDSLRCAPAPSRQPISAPRNNGCDPNHCQGLAWERNWREKKQARTPLSTARNIPDAGVPAQAPEPKPQGEPLLFSVGYDLRPLKADKFIWSFAFHIVAVVALLAATQFLVSHRQEIRTQITGMVTDISPYILSPSKTQAGGGGGGGDRDKLAASKGALPKFSREQITPPTVVVRNEAPKLTAPPTVVVPPEIRMPQSGALGDPLSAVLGPPSNGTGSGGGIGSGSGGGVGSGRGPGVGPGYGGGIGGGVYRVGGGVSAPRAIYSPEPEFSEEARKAKYQGVTVLWVVVGPDGRTRDIQIQRSLGMGLDEKAIAAVREWKFEPARKDGIPVAVKVSIEVSFRLY